MKLVIFFAFNLLFSSFLYSQRNIDSTAIRNWTSVEDAWICKSDSFFSYCVNSINKGSKTCFLKSLIDSSQLSFQNSIRSNFTKDGKFYVNLVKNDTVKIVDLANKSIRVFDNVSSLAYESINNISFLIIYSKIYKKLIIHDLTNKIEHAFSGVNKYFYKESSENILIEKLSFKSDSSKLYSVSFRSEKEKFLWTGAGFKGIVRSNDGTKMAVLYLKNGFNCIDELLLSNGTAKSLISESNKYNENIVSISGLIGYSSSDNGIIFSTLTKASAHSVYPVSSNLDIWSFKNPSLRFNSVREQNEINEKSFVFAHSGLVVDFEKNGWVTYIQAENIILLRRNSVNYFLDTIATSGNAGLSFALFNTSSGNFQTLKSEFVRDYSLSPNGKYIVSYDYAQGDYFSYEISSGASKCITCSLRINWKNDRDDHSSNKYIGGLVEAWTQNDLVVYMSDHYDIWALDPTGNKSPINLTHGLGRKQNVTFQIAKEGDVPENDSIILLKAYNHSTKENGFYQVYKRSIKGKIEKLYMGSFIFNLFPLDLKINPISQTGCKRNLVIRESETEARNIFLTSDFSKFEQLTFNAPHSKYNWLKTELISWKMPNNKTVDGVLYKPQNFDSTKKYPVIVNFYEILSDHIHEYKIPDFSRANIDIPYFVSNNYIVFTPDIHYKLGSPGASAYEHISLGVKSILNKSYIDKKHVGIQGHSFGGYQTNYIVTRTNLFAAAMSACGVSNILSHYNHDIDYHAFYLNGQGRIPVPAHLGIKNINRNSPLANVGKVNTPILIMANTNDTGVPFNQGFEFFVGLSALNKKCWLLNYYGEGHVIDNDASAKDFNKKLFEYFDFYLRNGPLPMWMN
jgi:dienelactone hydrolase